MKRLNTIFRLSVAAFCGAAAMFAWLTWIEWKSERTIHVRPPNVVLAEVDSARSALNEDGVFWSLETLQNTVQVKDIVALLEPNLRPFVMLVEGFDGVAIVSPAHPNFDDGWMSLHKTERTLIEMRPSE